ncbi:MAG: ribosomal protein S18-alanine N-acetyltransferase [Acidobacteria bacterium]|nr:ribosomal protein S18-alanine N-acetyltransferase [Acidobacteriota bacterium]MBI3655967.1 ribosomal protein S18-alanine N-acetyltransferase [Acidobacteriota bacterium]
MQIEISRINDSELFQIEEIERLTQLTFWGWDSYKTFIKDDDFIFARVARAAVNGSKKPVGFIIARFVEEDAEIMKIGVHPQYQKLGIGGRLLEVAIEVAQSHRCVFCYLEVRKSNIAAIQFYIDHYFDHCGYRKAYYASPVEDAYVMRRHLKRL